MKRFLLIFSLFVMASLEASTVQDGYNAVRNGNYEQGLKILLPIAEKGDPDALYGVGILYKEGWGAEKDLDKAVSFYEKAAEKGHVGAIFDLGWAYQTGQGKDKNYSKSAELYEKAATKGHPVAMYGLGGLYLNGLGVDKDVVKAEHWYKQSAAAGYPPAIEFVKEEFK
ncbi:tetratricopeptide repeat protein [Rheinheimera sp.]|uniref:tetratricopeptide repeat protein n=1 Tax=Rheinheimera sp. TaxID=1869214 RepID=UPI0027B9A985|nr:tetratricopeptide repeat protein [Rheinheimera sp.]